MTSNNKTTKASAESGSTKTVALADAAVMLAAIGHPVRLQAFRELVQAGPNGLPAGEMARMLHTPPSSLNFHLRALQQSGLVTSRTEGRFVIYTALFDSMSALLGFLTDNCCGGNPCMPIATSSVMRHCPAKPKTETS